MALTGLQGSCSSSRCLSVEPGACLPCGMNLWQSAGTGEAAQSAGKKRIKKRRTPVEPTLQSVVDGDGEPDEDGTSSTTSEATPRRRRATAPASPSEWRRKLEPPQRQSSDLTARPDRHTEPLPSPRSTEAERRRTEPCPRLEEETKVEEPILLASPVGRLVPSDSSPSFSKPDPRAAKTPDPRAVQTPDSYREPFWHKWRRHRIERKTQREKRLTWKIKKAKKSLPPEWPGAKQTKLAKFKAGLARLYRR